jgi:hypothetical protein
MRLTEGLDYRDFEKQIDPTVSVDEYSAKSGSDANMVTLAFIVKSKQAGKDLVDWLYRGYDWISDAQVSDGEITPGKYIVFVELNRRTSVPKRIIEILEDLETLTSLDPETDWKILIDDKEYQAVEEEIAPYLILSPHKYREQFPEEEETEDQEAIKDLEPEKSEDGMEISEMKKLSGIEVRRDIKKDRLLQDYLAKAGL